jgi:polyhydroxybutyrate depolymerase
LLPLVLMVAAACGASDDASSTAITQNTESVAPSTTALTTAPTTLIDTTLNDTTLIDTTLIDTTTVAPPATAPDEMVESPSSGCTNPGASAASVEVESGGLRRTSLLSFPPSSSLPAPFIIDLHGLGADATQEAAYSGVASRAPAAGFVVATPESAKGEVWFLPGVPGVDDVAFIRDLIETVGAQHCIDLDRVFVVGISNGGGLATGVACELGEVVRAVAPVAGVNIVKPCSSAVSVVAFHGTDDPLVPFAGGAPFSGMDRDDPSRDSQGARALSQLDLEGVDDAMAVWASNNGCDPTAVDIVVGTEVHKWEWSGCTPGHVVKLYVVDGGGHTWPGATPVPALGMTTAQIDATEIMIEAFASM